MDAAAVPVSPCVWQLNKELLSALRGQGWGWEGGTFHLKVTVI